MLPHKVEYYIINNWKHPPLSVYKDVNYIGTTYHRDPYWMKILFIIEEDTHTHTCQLIISLWVVLVISFWADFSQIISVRPTPSLIDRSPKNMTFKGPTDKMKFLNPFSFVNLPKKIPQTIPKKLKKTYMEELSGIHLGRPSYLKKTKRVEFIDH